MKRANQLRCCFCGSVPDSWEYVQIDLSVSGSRTLLPLKRVDLEGRSHGGTPTPHVQEFQRNVNPSTGQTYVNTGTVREAEPWEVPE